MRIDNSVFVPWDRLDGVGIDMTLAWVDRNNELGDPIPPYMGISVKGFWDSHMFSLRANDLFITRQGTYNYREFVDIERIPIPVAAQIIDGTKMIPLCIIEVLHVSTSSPVGFSIEWEAETNTAVIVSIFS